MKDYINTYDNQFSWETYSYKTILDDMLYGIGISLFGDKYRFNNGYFEFKKFLIDFLEEDFCKCEENNPFIINGAITDTCKTCHKKLIRRKRCIK